MILTKNQKLILFSIGEFYKNANLTLKGKPLEISISKISFIKILLEKHLSNRTERTLYYNLKNLEEKRLIDYDSKNIKITKRGTRIYNKLSKELIPYFEIRNCLNSSQTAQKLQTRIKL